MIMTRAVAAMTHAMAPESRATVLPPGRGWRQSGTGYNASPPREFRPLRCLASPPNPTSRQLGGVNCLRGRPPPLDAEIPRGNGLPACAQQTRATPRHVPETVSRARDGSPPSPETPPRTSEGPHGHFERPPTTPDDPGP